MSKGEDAKRESNVDGTFNWEELWPALRTFAVALLVTLPLSLGFAAAHCALSADWAAFSDLFGIYFQGIAALGALGAVAFELTRDARLRKQEEEQQLEKEKAFYNRKKFDGYYREACLVTAYEAELFGVDDDGKGSGRKFNYFVIENNSSGPIRDYSWRWRYGNEPKDVSTRGPYEDERNWGALPHGSWVIKKSKSGNTNFAWHYPGLVGADNKVVLRLNHGEGEDATGRVAQGDISAHTVNPEYKEIQILSLSFTDAYGNKWTRVFDGPADGQGHIILTFCPDDELWAWHGKLLKGMQTPATRAE